MQGFKYSVSKLAKNCEQIHEIKLVQFITVPFKWSWVGLTRVDEQWLTVCFSCPVL